MSRTVGRHGDHRPRRRVPRRPVRTGSGSSRPSSTSVGPRTPGSTAPRPSRRCAAASRAAWRSTPSTSATTARSVSPVAMPFTRGRALRDATLPWDVRQLHDDPDPAAPEPPCSTTSSTASPRSGCTSATTASPAPTCPSHSPTCGSTSPRSWSPRSPTSRAPPAPCSTSSATASVGRQPRPRPLRRGRPRLGTTPDLAPLADLVRECAHHDGWRAITVDARVLHDAGATDVDALAVAVATGVDYLRHLEAAGVPAPRRSASSSSGSGPPPTSSSPPPPCGRCAGSGPGSVRRPASPRTSAVPAPTP